MSYIHRAPSLRRTSRCALIGTLALAGLPAVTLHASPAAATPPRPLTAYVANMDADTVTPVNLATKSPGAPIPAGDGPTAIAMTPDGATAWVLDENDGSLVPIDTATNTAGTAIALGGGSDPVALAITPDGRKAYVAEHGLFLPGGVVAINLVTRTVGASIPMAGPTAIVISPDGTKAYVASDQVAGVQVIDTANDTVVDSFNYGGNSTMNATISPDGATIYLSQFRNGYVMEVDVAAPHAVRFNDGYSGPTAFFELSRGVAFSPDGSDLYVTDQHSLWKRSQGSFVHTPLPTVGFNNDSGLKAVAISPDGSTGYVTSTATNTITPFDTATLTLGAPIAVGANPWAVAITPDQAPTARLAVTRQPVGTPTTFDASASTVQFGTIATYAWDFGDGSTSVTTEPITTHTYTGGSYTASVTETSSAGTSTTSVFTGQSAMRNGGGRAHVTALGSLAQLGAPIVSQVTPQVASVVGGGTVNIIGSGFTTTTAVMFGANPATSVSVNGDNSITAVAPPGAAGPVDVTVTNSLGVSATSAADQYLYVGTVSNTSSCTATSCDVTVVQYGTVVSGTTPSTCNVCSFSAGIEPIQFPPTSLCPSGQQGMLEAGWVAAQQSGGSPLSSMLASITHMQAINQYIEDNNTAALKLISVCYIDGIPRPLPGAASRLAAPASNSYPLKSCVVTKNKVPCVASISLLANGRVNANLRLPTSGATFFIYTAPTTIKRVAPANALPGQTVTITGNHLTAVSSATIGGVDAPIRVRDDRHLYVTVPSGAQTSAITLMTPSGPVVSTTVVNVDPKITKFVKTSGAVGSLVTITGWNLSSVTSVEFNGMPTMFAALSNSSIIALVPAGATTGPITITSPDRSFTSAARFTVT